MPLIIINGHLIESIYYNLDERSIHIYYPDRSEQNFGAELFDSVMKSLLQENSNLLVDSAKSQIRQDLEKLGQTKESTEEGSVIFSYPARQELLERVNKNEGGALISIPEVILKFAASQKCQNF